MKKNRCLLSCYVMLLIFFSLMTESVQAAGPWIWKMTLTGVPSGKEMLMPSALFVDQERERYYVVDPGNNRLVSFDREGKFLNSFDAGGQLQTPYDMVRDAGGRLLIVEKGRNCLTTIDIQAKKVENHELRYGEKVIYPDRLESGRDGVLVRDKAGGDILALDDSLQVVQRFSCKECAEGFADFKYAENMIWALVRGENSVYRFPVAGGESQVIPLSENLQFPSALAIGPAGRLYVTERHGGQIAVFDNQGNFKYRFLRPGQTRSRLYYPADILFDPWGNLCVVEEANGRVQVFGRQ